MRVIALVPARAGSKSIKKKNLQEVSGTSLLEISVSHAKAANQVDEVFISSDSSEILELASSLGCKPINRPVDAASDSATANDVVKDFISQTKLLGQPDTLIVYLQPTSPFRNDGLITKGLDLYFEKLKPVVAVTEVQQHPYKTLVVDSRGELRGFLEGGTPTANRQSLPPVVIPSGSLYIFSVHDFQQANSIPITGTQPLFVSGIYALDIDTEIDLRIAQKIGNDYEL